MTIELIDLIIPTIIIVVGFGWRVLYLQHMLARKLENGLSKDITEIKSKLELFGEKLEDSMRRIDNQHDTQNADLIKIKERQRKGK